MNAVQGDKTKKIVAQSEILAPALASLVSYARLDAHAERFKQTDGTWGYKPVNEPLSDEKLRSHLNGGPHLGIYFMRPGAAETSIAVLDLDDHDGDLGWKKMRDTALRVADGARKCGLIPWPVRSGGGCGVHLFFRWDRAQPAANVRQLLTSVLAAEGFENGVNGIATGQIEIFPKQNDVTNYGNPIAIPFARASKPLGPDMEPVDKPSLWSSSAPVILEVQQSLHDASSTASHDLDAIREALTFLAADDYTRWINVGLALKNDLSDAGYDIWDQWSKQSDNYDGPASTENKWKGFKRLRGSGAITLGTIFHWAREAGWTPAPRQFASRTERPWPDPICEEAFHGLAGAIAKAIAPHTESDEVAILVQTLAAFGNSIGRRNHYYVDGSRHHANLYVVVVGRSSKARKGTGWARVKETFRTASLEDDWITKCIRSGLSSGEGLIESVRDARTKQEEDKKSNTFKAVITDPGVDDKRLLVVESEFSRTLRTMGRDGNTLSAIMRDAWDGNDLAVMNKNSPLYATAPHISILAHVTTEDLRRYLDATDAANGFGNRYIYLCAKRSQHLPVGPDEQALHSAIQPLQMSLKKAVSGASEQESDGDQPAEVRLKFDDAACALWFDVYADLSKERPGMLGAITGRAEAQTVRLALIYALLDSATEIRLEHLRAALAVWRYAEASAAFIFGDSLGDPVADTVLIALRGAGAKGLTRTALNGLFAGHKSGAALARALTLLIGQQLVTMERHETGGRPTEVWCAR